MDSLGRALITRKYGEQQDTSAESIRRNIRDYLRQNREKKRTEKIDSMRCGLGDISDQPEDSEIQVSKEQVVEVAQRIKEKNEATCSDMFTLSLGFLNGMENINAFMKIPGALNVVVKNLIGTRIDYKISAAECLCNLTLGESYVSDRIVASAGIYLITLINSAQEQLKRLSIWILINIFASQAKSGKTLTAMELVPKLWSIYNADNPPSNYDFRKDAALCLHFLVMCPKYMLKTEDQLFIKDNLHLKNPTTDGAEYHLQILMCAGLLEPSFVLSELQLRYIGNFAIHNITCTNEVNTMTKRLKVFYAVRILSTIVKNYGAAFGLLQELMHLNWNITLKDLMNKLKSFQNVFLATETITLANNLIQHAKQKATDIDVKFLQELLCVLENQMSQVSSTAGRQTN